MSIVKKPSALSNWFLPGILSGMGFTLKTMLKNLLGTNKKSLHKTYNYPEEHYKYSPRFKGNHILTVKKDGSLRCTACMLCATNCPADCISITASEHEDPTVEKFATKYEIDILRCVFCGFCEEACPVDAVRMGPEWQVPTLNGGRVIYDIQHLAYRDNLNGGKGILTRVDDEERDLAGI